METFERLFLKGFLSMTWRVIVHGQTYETNQEELKQWVRGGRVLPTDQVFRPDVGWVIASQIPELQSCFPSRVMPPPPFGGMPGSGMAPSPYAASYTPPLPYAPLYGQAGGYLPQPIVLRTPASLGRRLLGSLVDTFISLFFTSLGWLTILIALEASASRSRSSTDGDMLMVGCFLLFLGGFVYLLLNSYLISRSGATIGKKFAGTVILRDDGRYLSFGRALLRELLKGVFGNACFLFNLWLLFDSENQQLYDKAVRANVYKAS
ncbi:RDD family protein [Chloracidobacterium validum]|uniref:RDD family protein n=1 Tax=Chloracidobacterium validum TaxID=2821543 RepID=A0ABX8BCL2_9BACT|nr:RDD family protein [Chloracidobacterium validum]QUW03771.1 RDD family protein [Chloracidobacterium validum]